MKILFIIIWVWNLIICKHKVFFDMAELMLNFPWCNYTWQTERTLYFSLFKALLNTIVHHFILLTRGTVIHKSELPWYNILVLICISSYFIHVCVCICIKYMYVYVYMHNLTLKMWNVKKKLIIVEYLKVSFLALSTIEYANVPIMPHFFKWRYQTVK